MTTTQNELKLAAKLSEIVESAPKGSTALAYHLFAIIYANDMRANNITPSILLELAQLPASYQVELNKGINISEYVSVSKDRLWFDTAL